ncbi:MAG: restriction endonuclease subunit S [Taibaiella sp.]|nr:restriction endonuclease subunit S [Taibaiella sp.]
MSKEQKNKLVPALRFPEFKDNGVWEEKELGEILVEGRLGGNYENSEADAGIPVIKMGNLDRGIINTHKLQYLPKDSEYFEEDILNKNDLLLNTRNTLELVGKVAIWREELSKALYNSNLLRMTFHKDVIANNVFMNYLFNTQTTISSLRSIATGTTSVAAIYTKDLLKLIISFPSLSEQQKIADCLSSLDELIDAESQKLDALKDHKKGLMQQLFPAQGKTVPELRFPGFEGEWEEKTLGEMANNLNSKRIPITESERENGEIPYYGASGIIDYVKDYIFDDNLLCISEDGANLVTRTYPIAFSISGKTWVNNHAHVLKFESEFTHVLVENYLNAINLEAFLTGAAQPKLNRAKLDIIPIPIPDSPNEQRNIADCLTVIDELITAQAERIEHLKEHKKGLMQQLFPSV